MQDQCSGRLARSAHSRSENVCVAIHVCPTASVAISVIGVLATQGSGVSSMTSGLDITVTNSWPSALEGVAVGHSAFKIGF